MRPTDPAITRIELAELISVTVGIDHSEFWNEKKPNDCPTAWEALSMFYRAWFLTDEIDTWKYPLTVETAKKIICKAMRRRLISLSDGRDKKRGNK